MIHYKSKISILLTLIFFILSLHSCKQGITFFKKGEIVAKVGKHKLYLSKLRSFIPKDASVEDSTNLALQYINSWASNQVFLDIAEKQLSKTEKDVEGELEEYRQTLLKYRYEQRYVNERLDTVVSEDEIEKYYNEHRKNFILKRPIVKARYLNTMKDSPYLEVIKKKMTSKKAEDILEADSLAFSSALKYVDYSEKWTDISWLANQFGLDYMSLLSLMKKNLIERQNDLGDVNVAYITEILKTDAIAPLEYCSEQIREIILSLRKQALINTLEKELLEYAKNKKDFVIY